MERAEAPLNDMRKSNSARAQIFGASLRRSELEHQQLHIAKMGDACIGGANPHNVTRHGTPNSENGASKRRKSTETKEWYRCAAGTPENLMEAADLSGGHL